MDNRTDDTGKIVEEEARRDKIPWEGAADTPPLRNTDVVVVEVVAAGLDMAVVAVLVVAVVAQRKDPVVVASILVG